MDRAEVARHDRHDAFTKGIRSECLNPVFRQIQTSDRYVFREPGTLFAAKNRTAKGTVPRWLRVILETLATSALRLISGWARDRVDDGLWSQGLWSEDYDLR